MVNQFGDGFKYIGREIYRGNKLILNIDTLINYYITENHSAKETVKYFGITLGNLTVFLNHYNTKKPKSLSRVHNKKTCLEKYGDTNYNNHKQQIETCKQRYGVENTFQVEQFKIKASNTKLERYGNPNFMNIEKSRQTCLEKYGVEHPSQLDSVKEQKRKTCLEHYGVEYPMQAEEVKAKYDFEAVAEKAFNTKKKNGTTNTSAIQKTLTEILIDKYGKEDIFTEYKESRYPYHCDFYIKSLDLFIELNLYFTHGGHPFIGSQEDLEFLETWKAKAVGSKFYSNAIHVWTISDPEKQECAKKNGLNYKMFYTMQEVNDFIKSLK